MPGLFAVKDYYTQSTIVITGPVLLEEWVEAGEQIHAYVQCWCKKYQFDNMAVMKVDSVNSDHL